MKTASSSNANAPAGSCGTCPSVGPVQSRRAHELRSVADTFIRHFKLGGYRNAPPISLVPPSDRTVLFTSATITTFRDLLAVKDGRHVVAQKCLRLHNLARLGDVTFDPGFMSVFTMVGILDTSDDLGQICERISSCLCEAFGVVNRLHVYVRASERELFADFVDRLPSEVTVVMDASTKQYDWTYGEPGLVGRGLPLALACTDGTVREFGQVVAIFNDGNRVGVEFGFGVETFLSILHSEASPFCVASVWDVVNMLPNRSKTFRKHYADLLAVFAHLICAGVPPGRGSRGSVARKVGRRLAGWALEHAIDPLDVKQHLRDVTVLYGLPGDFTHEVETQWWRVWVKYKDAMQRFICFEKNQKHLHTLGKLRADQVERNIARHLEKLNLYGGVREECADAPDSIALTEEL